jgi:hypothetical protein
VGAGMRQCFRRFDRFVKPLQLGAVAARAHMINLTDTAETAADVGIHDSPCANDPIDVVARSVD